MTHTAPSRAPGPMLLLLAMLLTGCATPQTPPPLPAQAPALPPQARQPALPEWCSPTCSAALERELLSWRQRLTQPMQPASGASAPISR